MLCSWLLARMRCLRFTSPWKWESSRAVRRLASRWRAWRSWRSAKVYGRIWLMVFLLRVRWIWMYNETQDGHYSHTYWLSFITALTVLFLFPVKVQFELPASCQYFCPPVLAG